MMRSLICTPGAGTSSKEKGVVAGHGARSAAGVEEGIVVGCIKPAAVDVRETSIQWQEALQWGERSLMIGAVQDVLPQPLAENCGSEILLLEEEIQIDCMQPVICDWNEEHTAPQSEGGANKKFQQLEQIVVSYGPPSFGDTELGLESELGLEYPTDASSFPDLLSMGGLDEFTVPLDIFEPTTLQPETTHNPLIGGLPGQQLFDFSMLLKMDEHPATLSVTCNQELEELVNSLLWTHETAEDKKCIVREDWNTLDEEWLQPSEEVEEEVIDTLNQTDDVSYSGSSDSDYCYSSFDSSTDDETCMSSSSWKQPRLDSIKKPKTHRKCGRPLGVERGKRGFGAGKGELMHREAYARLSTVDRYDRKKEQNKNAAIKYRERKRAEAEEKEEECAKLATRNSELKKEVAKKEHEVKMLKKLFFEVVRGRHSSPHQQRVDKATVKRRHETAEFV